MKGPTVEGCTFMAPPETNYPSRAFHYKRSHSNTKAIHDSPFHSYAVHPSKQASIPATWPLHPVSPALSLQLVPCKQMKDVTLWQSNVDAHKVNSSAMHDKGASMLIQIHLLKECISTKRAKLANFKVSGSG